MKFLEVVEYLQNKKENRGYIVFVRCGIFFSAIGKDAVIINRYLNLKPVCMKDGICKCGIPVSSFKNYIPILKDYEISYVIYDYEKTMLVEELQKYKEIARVNGKMIEEANKCIGCDNCIHFKTKTTNDITSNIKIIEEMLNG